MSASWYNFLNVAPSEERARLRDGNPLLMLSSGESAAAAAGDFLRYDSGTPNVLANGIVGGNDDSDVVVATEIRCATGEKKVA